MKCCFECTNLMVGVVELRETLIITAVKILAVFI